MSGVPLESGDPSTGTPPCRCGALMQQSWWQEVLENERYHVERVDVVNRIAEVITISVSSGPGSGPTLFLTVADVDWPALLANFAEPFVTRNGEHTAMAAHDELLSGLRQLLTLDRDPPTGQAETELALGAGSSSTREWRRRQTR